MLNKSIRDIFTRIVKVESMVITLTKLLMIDDQMFKDQNV